MKKLCFILLLLPVFAAGKAQLYVQPGATWLFRSQMWGIEYGEKWEYYGHTGSAYIMRVTTKCFNAFPGFAPCTVPTVTYRNLDITGDKVVLDGRTIVDFSVQTGDSLPSPFTGGVQSPGFDSVCDSVQNHPAVVTETGVETISGSNYRYYKLRFLAGLDLSDSTPVWGIRKFSERTWITDGYWWIADSWTFAPGCPIVDGYLLRYLICYYDNENPSIEPCAEEWFDKMEVEQADIQGGVRVYPNPAVETLYLTLPQQAGMWRYKVVSADGKRVSGGSLAGNTVDVSPLSPGMYLLVLENGTALTRHAFVKQ